MLNELITKIRKEYAQHGLREEDLDVNPFVQFQRWLQEALDAQLPEPNAMMLATATKDGKPSVRVVLLRGVDERGFFFYTDYRSRKSKELLENPHAALVFFWQELERQVRIEGVVEKTSAKESNDYFQTRPFESRVAAWASDQSSVLPNRQTLEKKFEELQKKYDGKEVPLPPFWGGFRLIPDTIEFWQGREHRLHDRLRYAKQREGWIIDRLSP